MINAAKFKYLRISPQKLNRVARLVDKLSVKKAQDLLNNLQTKGAKLLKKAIENVVANMNHKSPVNIERLFISEVVVEQGPTMKRVLPRSRGSRDLIHKRTSHVKVTLASK